MENDHMIEALTPNGPNHALDVGPLPGGARRGQYFADAHVSHLFSEVIAEDGIAVAEQVTQELVEGKSLPQLLSRPLGRRMGGHIAMDNATSVMGQYQKHVKNLETNSRHSEEVDGDQLLGVILQKGAPGLRWRLAAAHHLFADAGLADVYAELEQLPWMRVHPIRFSRHILRIRSRISWKWPVAPVGRGAPQVRTSESRHDATPPLFRA